MLSIFSSVITTVCYRVVPEVVSFLSLNEEETFDVTVVGTGLPDGSQAVSALLVWSDIPTVLTVLEVHLLCIQPRTI